MQKRRIYIYRKNKINIEAHEKKEKMKEGKIRKNEEKLKKDKRKNIRIENKIK